MLQYSFKGQGVILLTMEAAIYTDGSSLGNPGPGGFCAIIKRGKEKIIAKGGEAETTNNRMELAAVIAGLFTVRKHFPKDATAKVYSDSSLVIQTMKVGWKRKKNLDLWEKLDHIVGEFEKVSWQWVRGHAGHPENTEADKVAVSEATKQKRKLHAK